MIKKLILQNFQKHSKLELNFNKGVNILTGASGTGKSCIRRSLEWLFQNESIDGIRKTGTKQTSVEVILENGYQVERIKSASINRYIIRKGESEQVFDSIGKTIPDEVKKVLGIYPIEVDGEQIYLNSYPQIGLPFLFDKSPSFRMKLFNQLTGNDVLDKLFGEFNKDILKFKRNIREEDEIFEEREVSLKSKKIEMEKIVAVHTRLKKRIKSLVEKYEKYSKLLKLKELMESNLGKKKKIVEDLESINIPQSTVIEGLRSNIDKYMDLLSLKNAYEKVDTGLYRVREQLKVLKPVSIDLGDLRGNIERFDRIKSIYEKFSQIKSVQGEFEKKLKVVNMDIKCDHKELDKYEICKECDGRGVKFNE